MSRTDDAPGGDDRPAPPDGAPPDGAPPNGAPTNGAVAGAPDGHPAPAEGSGAARGQLGPDVGPDDSPFLVVGLGASAGGVEALEAFFAGLPQTDGAAFVVVIHLSPDRESQMADILERSVPLPVTQVTERVEVRPGHVYVIPPNRNLLMEDGHLRLAPLEDERHRRRPIDHFFRTLAEAYGEHAVGVVLSGTGQNGTVGVSRVQEVGGLVLAQDPSDAAYDEMPRSAIAAGVVDNVASAGDARPRGHRLRRPAQERPAPRRRRRRPRRRPGGPAHARVPEGADGPRLRPLQALDGPPADRPADARRRRRHARRLPRRTLRRTPGEAALLLDDLLISVTNFFRDADPFEVLAASVVPGLFEGKGPEGEVRVWVAGCATGEEAYSVAMLLCEHAATLPAPPRVQVFATDLSERAVAVGRAGVYPESIEADVSPERLRRFFRRTAGGYRVAEGLRETVLFAPHSLLKDPPFAHLDLVTCRNLLIYLQRGLQQRVFELFHYALEPGGVLFLGTSETADAGAELFQAESKEARIYRRREVETALPSLPRSPRVPAPPAPPAPPDERAGAPVSFAEVHRMLRAEAAPPSVLVGENREVVHLSGGAGAFLQMGSGEPTRNVLRLVLPALRPVVQAALYQTRREGGEVVSGPVSAEVEGAPRSVRVRARPAAEGDLVQVLFETVPAASGAALTDPSEREAALHAEVQEVREQLQLSVEEFETSREELKAQNEELQSINEELRSTAEELETAKEESQSMAEELLTVNDEMKAKMEELARAKGDIENLVTSTEIATLFLDRGLRIQRFTPRVRDHFHVQPSDVGRPLADFAPRFGGADVEGAAAVVLDRLEPQEREVRGADGRWYLVQARPYRTVEDRIDGVVVTFVDITARRASEEEVRRSEERFRALVETSAQIVWTAEADGSVHGPDGDRGLAVVAGVHGPDGRRVAGRLVGGRPPRRPRGGPGGAGGGRGRGRAVRAGVPAPPRADRVVAVGPARRVRDARAAPLREPGGAVRGWVAMAADETERRQAAAALRDSEERYRLLVEGATEYAILTMDPAGRVTMWNPGAEAVFGHAEADVLGRSAALLFTDEDRAAGVFEAEMERSAREGEAVDDRWLVRADGSRVWVNGVMTVLRDPGGAARGFAKVLRDGTARKEAEDALRASEERFRQAVAAADLGTWTYDPAAEVSHFDARTREIFGTDTDAPTPAEVNALIHPDDRGAFEAARDAALAPGGSDVFAETHRIVRPDGGVRWVRGHARVLFEGEGVRRRPARTVGVVFDVTDQHEATAALQASEERFRRTSETVPDILFTAGPDGRIDYVNARFEEVTGRPVEAALGTEMWDGLVHPDDRGAAEAVLDAGRGGEPYEARHRMKAADGSYRWFLTRAQPVRDDGGAVTAWFGTSTDVDEIVRAEEEIQTLNATLERRVRQRTALARRLLARLTVAEEEERQRIAQVLHDDLQQQLYGLAMTLSLAGQQGATDGALLAKAEGILDGAVTLTRTLAAELSPAVLDTDSLGDVFDWLASHMKTRYGLDVETSVEAGCRIADPTVRVALYQVLRELLFNVVKHAGTDHAHLTARPAPAETAPGGVVVTVEDGGAGFDPATVAGGGGTGLGLASLHGRLELVGGRIEVDSAPGDGTRIAITVPAGEPTLNGAG